MLLLTRSALNLLVVGFTPRALSEQLGKTRSRKDLLEGWIIEGSDYQPGLLDILKSSRTPEVWCISAASTRTTPAKVRSLSSPQQL